MHTQYWAWPCLLFECQLGWWEEADFSEHWCSILIPVHWNVHTTHRSAIWEIWHLEHTELFSTGLTSSELSLSLLQLLRIIPEHLIDLSGRNNSRGSGGKSDRILSKWKIYSLWLREKFLWGWHSHCLSSPLTPLDWRMKSFKLRAFIICPRVSLHNHSCWLILGTSPAGSGSRLVKDT